MQDQSILILSAGMPRSGSTWLYNAIRLIINSSAQLAENFSCGWVDNVNYFDSLNKKPNPSCTLIKMHYYDQELVNHADYIFYSYRDLRDALASSKRVFNGEPLIELADEWIKEYSKWTQVANFVMKYELMLEKKEEIIQDLANILKIDIGEPAKIQKQIMQMHYGSQGDKNLVYNEVNLLHRNHITNGKYGTWTDSLNQEFIEQVEQKHRQWFLAHDYPLPSNINSMFNIYQQYLRTHFSTINSVSLPFFKSAQNTDWENPTTAIELNNFAVIQIIEAENNADPHLRQFNLDLAIEALQMGINQENHPLCFAHLAIVKSLLGETNYSHNLEYSKILELLPKIFTQEENLPSGLVYLPISLRNKSQNRENLQKIIALENGYLQAFYLLAADLGQSQMVFYNPLSLRFLDLVNQIIPDSVNIKLNLGVSNLFNQKMEGLLCLHQAHNLDADNSQIIQALYLAYRDLKKEKLSQDYYQLGKLYHQQNVNNYQWKWADLSPENPWTYVVFDSLLMAVEASFRSIVTAVLLTQEDWFEREMELWREEIQPNMIVIDVGANVGVYTFSAAQRVGANGKVIAVEPFFGCVECLQETRRFNQLDWVTICAGAAGETNKTVKLSLNAASELNEVIKDNSTVKGNYQEVECFTLDSLVEKYNLSTVNWLKLDAEGNEMQVLQGSGRILADFKPNILYENIAGSQGANTAVAEFLLSIGYKLFYYQPFVKQLIELQSLDELVGKLNIIAKYSN